MNNIFFIVGVFLMVLASVLAIISIIAFTITGKQIRKVLEEEYGKRR